MKLFSQTKNTFHPKYFSDKIQFGQNISQLILYYIFNETQNACVFLVSSTFIFILCDCTIFMYLYYITIFSFCVIIYWINNYYL